MVQVFFFLIILSGAVFAQIHASSNTVKQSEDFVSVDGGFTIDLPSKVTRFSSVEPIEGITGGGSKMGWDSPQGVFVFSFTNYLKTPENPSKIFEELNNDVVRSITNQGGKIISKKETSFAGNPGLEAKLHFGKGGTAIYRYFFVKNRLFILTTMWKDGGSGEQELKILDSFRLLDQNAALFKQIEAMTPKVLPQSPVVAKLKSDAEDDNLKGKVKTVTQEEEYLKETDDIKGRYFDRITDFNESGNKIKELIYVLEMPFAVSVFGYIDGMRVLNSKVLADVPDLSFLRKKDPKSPKAPDPRYEFSIEYKYSDGKLSEEKWLKNDGSDWMKIFYKSNGNQVEEIAYDEWGRVNRRSISTLDDKGNKVEQTDVDENNRRYIIKYDSFDAKGNWTKSTKSEIIVKNEKQVYEPSFIYYRTITYYP